MNKLIINIITIIYNNNAIIINVCAYDRTAEV